MTVKTISTAVASFPAPFHAVPLEFGRSDANWCRANLDCARIVGKTPCEVRHLCREVANEHPVADLIADLANTEAPGEPALPVLAL